MREPRGSSPSDGGYEWCASQERVLLQWSGGEHCVMHVLIAHAVVKLLCYGPSMCECDVTRALSSLVHHEFFSLCLLISSLDFYIFLRLHTPIHCIMYAVLVKVIWLIFYYRWHKQRNVFLAPIHLGGAGRASSLLSGHQWGGTVVAWLAPTTSGEVGPAATCRSWTKGFNCSEAGRLYTDVWHASDVDEVIIIHRYHLLKKCRN